MALCYWLAGCPLWLEACSRRTDAVQVLAETTIAWLGVTRLLLDWAVLGLCITFTRLVQKTVMSRQCPTRDYVPTLPVAVLSLTTQSVRHACRHVSWLVGSQVGLGGPGAHTRCGHHTRYLCMHVCAIPSAHRLSRRRYGPCVAVRARLMATCNRHGPRPNPRLVARWLAPATPCSCHPRAPRDQLHGTMPHP